MKAMRQKRGLDARSGRKERLKVKHAKREARAAEMHRIAALTVVTRFSQLRSMPNGDLSDQLKYHKQVREKKGFTVTFPARKGYVLQLHALLLEVHGAAANDLMSDDDPYAAVGVKRKPKPRAPKEKGAAQPRTKKQKKLTNACGDEWEADDEFSVEAIVGTKVSAGVQVWLPPALALPHPQPSPPTLTLALPPRQADAHRKGTTLYRVIWLGFDAEAATWEPASNICADTLASYVDGVRREAEAEAAAEAELEDDEDDEDCEDAA